MICDVCSTEQAQYLLGNMENGEQKAFCVSDFARFGLDYAKLVLPPEEILDVLGIAPAGVAVNGKAVKAKAPKRAKPPAAPPEPEPDAGTATGPPEVAASPADE